MKIVCLIGARGGSKTIPLKNIVKLGEHPLIAYSIAAGVLAENIDEVIVSTDSEKIADVARKYGAKVPFLRPAEFAQDESTDVYFIQHYLTTLEQSNEEEPDFIVLLRPTTPLRNVKVIDKAIVYMKSDKQATSLRSMHKSTVVPYKMFLKDGDYAKPAVGYDSCEEYYNWPRQKFEQTFDPNGYVDILTPACIKQGLLTGERLKIWETDRVPDIDTRDDFQYAVKHLSEDCYKSLKEYLENTHGHLS
jgi:CMP-N,N'-diacetyllegionaminic acid synthase